MENTHPLTHPPASNPGLYSRFLALRTLEAVWRGTLEYDRALERHIERGALVSEEKAFARRLVVTTVRYRGAGEYLARTLLKRPLPETAQRLASLLALGLTQLLWMEIPAYAVVNTMVNLTKAVGQPRLAGLVNAVLKRASREGKTLLAASELPVVNTPQWLWDRWRAHYGKATARAIAYAHLQEPPLDVSCISAVARPNAPHRRSVSCRLSHPGAVTALPDYDKGTWWVQDVAATLPVHLLGDVREKTVLDLCAAPGGKNAQLATAGARVIAVDKSARRITRLQENLTRLRLAVEVVCADVFDLQGDRQAEAVLLDAPCSATGTLRRHPEVAWQRQEEDIARLADIQRKLLAHVASLVKPGGLLVYAVCSLEPEEGERQIERVQLIQSSSGLR
jgi:16S rRNA (cytosine967-C5)-methyltransferase